MLSATDIHLCLDGRNKTIDFAFSLSKTTLKMMERNGKQ